MHIWVILDWNRRWAKERWLWPSEWHNAWLDLFFDLIDWTLDKKNITHLSTWVLAKKNIENRWFLELKHLYYLIEKTFKKMLKKAQENNIKIDTVWDLTLLPEKTQKIINNWKKDTKNNTWLNLIIALWYWWQDEIVRWVKKYIKHLKENNLYLDNLNDLDEKSFYKFLDSWSFKEPDLIIRTWWDMRLSWYFLYASEYSEYYFTDTYWPAFTKEEFSKAINTLSEAKRNFWK